MKRLLFSPVVVRHNFKKGINDSQFLNLEIQVYHDKNWIERSISYTSRSFDNLNHGEAYDKVLPVTHIGFLNFTLFPDYPEFYAGYQLMNEKNSMSIVTNSVLVW